jgi:tRNA A37 threonylcarbamoyladenosine biosynthesis protein TsaE
MLEFYPLKISKSYQPTRGQSQMIHELGGYLASDDLLEVMMIKGYAGTGKTTLVSSLVKTLEALKQKCVLLAPTGRAAKVLSSYSGRPAWTIHKKIYRQKSGRDGLGEFVLDRNLHKNTYFIVDEASMIGPLTRWAFDQVTCHAPAQIRRIGIRVQDCACGGYGPASPGGNGDQPGVKPKRS